MLNEIKKHKYELLKTSALYLMTYYLMILSSFSNQGHVFIIHFHFIILTGRTWSPLPFIRKYLSLLFGQN